MKKILFALLIPVSVGAQKPMQPKKDLSLQFINHNIKPGDNFFMYANGRWYDTATILPTETGAGARIDMSYITKNRIKQILENSAAAKNVHGSISQQVGDFFASGMNTNNIEKAGYSPLKAWLLKIEKLKTVNEVLQFAAQQTTLGNPSLVRVRVAGDFSNSQKNIAIFSQAGLGLPDRDYYLKTDSASVKIALAYKRYITQLLTLAGTNKTLAEKRANEIFDLEKQIALTHRTAVEIRDPKTNNNKTAVADMKKQMPQMGWQNILSILRITSDSVNIQQPLYFTSLNELLQKIPVDRWKPYLQFHLLNNTAAALSPDFVNASFEFKQKILLGQKELKPRWEQIYELIDTHIGEALGELYVKKYFTAEAKNRMHELVKNLRMAFENRIKKLDWMSDSTKEKAIAKLHTFNPKVGYPDRWRDYSKLEISKNDFFGNVMRAKKHNYDFQVSKLNKPVDRSEWAMTPQTNNAYFNPSWNEIVFPAGILQYPMFDVDADDAMNYGGIGMVIGHEMTHGFDNRGALYDKEGNLNNWWGKEDFDKFKAKGDQVVKLYSSFIVLDSIHVNGKLTQSENTADIGGLAIAYDAFKLTKQGQGKEKIDGLTPDQRFFLSHAQSWRRKIKDEALLLQINTDSHSPSVWRPIGALMNFTPFYEAYNVKPGDKMYLPEKDRIHIW